VLPGGGIFLLCGKVEVSHVSLEEANLCLSLLSLFLLSWGH